MSFTLFLATAVEAAAGASTNPVMEVVKPFGWNAYAFFSQVISFSIVCALLYKFAYNPVLTMLEQRRAKIEEGLVGAEKIKAQLADATKAAEEIRAQANADAQKAIAEAQAAAKAITEREGQRAVAQATEIIQKAREAGEAEQKRLMAELRKDLSRLIVDTTAKVTGKALNAADQAAITEAANKELAA